MVWYVHWLTNWREVGRLAIMIKRRRAPGHSFASAPVVDGDALQHVLMLPLQHLLKPAADIALHEEPAIHHTGYMRDVCLLCGDDI